MRSRRWGAPRSAARRRRNDPTYPASARSAMTVPRADSPGRAPILVASPGTFSTSTSRGCSRRTARAMSNQRALRSPWRRPRCRPARERSWQGNPPASSSTRGVPASISRTSPSTSRAGRWRAMTRWHPGSFSAAHSTRQPACSRPRSRPRHPEKREPTVPCTPGFYGKYRTEPFRSPMSWCSFSGSPKTRM